MIVRCATSNPGKLREFRLAGAEDGNFAVEPVANLRDIPPPEETGDTFELNAVEKALYYAAHTGGWMFAEDSGLEVEALDGSPGVYSARFAGPDADDRANNSLLLEKLNGVADRRAQFVCLIALAREGVTALPIARVKRTPSGIFQADPYFVPPLLEFSASE